MNNEYLSLFVIAERVKGEKDGKKYDFISYKGSTKKGIKCRYKFPKSVLNAPSEPGIYCITVHKSNINRDKRYTYPVYWIKEIGEVTQEAREVKPDNAFKDFE